MAQDRPIIAHVLHRLDRAGAEVLAADLSRGLKDRFDFLFICLAPDELAAWTMIATTILNLDETVTRP